MSKLELGINKVTNKEYHSDKTYLSSSNLKDLLKDRKKFYEEKILGNKREQEDKPAFAEGSLVHSLILEPHLVEQEFAFFEGLRKQGEMFERFKTANMGKTILSKSQKVKCEYYVQGFKRQKVGVQLISGGESEHTICAMINDVPIKVRCDYINLEKQYIVDVKTSGFSVDQDSFRITSQTFGYDLSGALYALVAEQHYGIPFDFFFVAISKTDASCEVFKLSEDSKKRGLLKISKALNIYKECLKTGNWENNNAEQKFSLSDYEILEV